MRVFVTGASGWIGSAVVPELLGAGHSVVGLARSDGSAARLEAAGAEALRGDLGDAAVLRAGAEAADGVVHLAFGHDFSRFDAAVEADRVAVDVLAEALAGSGRPLVAASGTSVIPGRVATERDRTVPGAAAGPAAGRARNAQLLLATAGKGVRASVVGLPRSVHGRGDHGFVPRLIGLAREHGVSGWVGDGSSRWPAVHVLDAARLFRLALEEAPAGSVLHAVGDEGVPTRAIAETIGRHLGLPAGPQPAEGFGFLGGLLAIDQPASAELTRSLLGWEPAGPRLLADLDEGHYFA